MGQEVLSRAGGSGTGFHHLGLCLGNHENISKELHEAEGLGLQVWGGELNGGGAGETGLGVPLERDMDKGKLQLKRRS